MCLGRLAWLLLNAARKGKNRKGKNCSAKRLNREHLYPKAAGGLYAATVMAA